MVYEHANVVLELVAHGDEIVDEVPKKRRQHSAVEGVRG